MTQQASCRWPPELRQSPGPGPGCPLVLRVAPGCADRGSGGARHRRPSASCERGRAVRPSVAGRSHGSLALRASSRGLPPRVALCRNRRTAAAQAVPEPGRRTGDPAPAWRPHQLLGEVSARSRQVRVLRGRDQNRVRGKSPPFLPQLNRSTHLSHGPVRWATAPQPDDAVTSLAAFFLHSFAHFASPAGIRAPPPKHTPRRCGRVDSLPVELSEPMRRVERTSAGVVTVRQPLDAAAPGCAATPAQSSSMARAPKPADCALRSAAPSGRRLHDRWVGCTDPRSRTPASALKVDGPDSRWPILAARNHAAVKAKGAPESPGRPSWCSWPSAAQRTST